MTRISKQKITDEIYKAIEKNFVTLMLKVHKKDAAVAVMDELFSETEKIMFAKRLTVIVMLSRNYSAHDIQEVLHISSSTIALMTKNFFTAKYSGIQKHFLSNKNQLKYIENLINTVLSFRLPPRTGRDRWKNYRSF